MNLPQVASEAGWKAARKELLVKEKELTRLRDALTTRATRPRISRRER